jgi:hypothetical protein
MYHYGRNIFNPFRGWCGSPQVAPAVNDIKALRANISVREFFAINGYNVVNKIGTIYCEDYITMQSAEQKPEGL